MPVATERQAQGVKRITMAVKVLVVDDSSFFRRRVSEIINQDPLMTVIDTAQNGREAVD